MLQLGCRLDAEETTDRAVRGELTLTSSPAPFTCMLQQWEVDSTGWRCS